MIKKSLFALFTTLIAGGVLLVGSTEGFKYTAKGTSVISFELDKLFLIEGIKYGSGTLKTYDMNNCTHENYGEQCIINSEGEYDEYDVEITYASNNYKGITNIRMGKEPYNNTIKKIENFDGIKIKDINTLDLSHNSGIDLNNQASYKIETILVNSCNLNEFKLNVNSRYFKNIYFNDNKLTTLSGEIRCNRDNYLIHLDHNVSIGNANSNDYNIWLESNPINFIGLTKYYYTDRECVKNYGGYGYNCSNERDIECENNDIIFKNETGYSFERFGYQEQDGTDLTYKYTISGTDFNTGRIIVSKTGVTIPAEYLPFSNNPYTLTVCIQENTDICDSINFLVKNDNLKLEFIENETNIESGGTANSLTDVTFARIHTGIDDNAYKYPEEQIYGYEYRLYKNNNYQPIVNSTLEKTCNYDGENCHGTKNIGQALTDEGIFDTYKDLTGDFKFEVYILDNDNHSYIYGDDNEPIRATRYFHIVEPEQPDDPEIEIIRPNPIESGASTEFSWDYTLDLAHFNFGNFSWIISGLDNNIFLTGIEYDKDNRSFSTGILISGNYIFTVNLHYSNQTDSLYVKSTKNFKVKKSLPRIKILKPSNPETESTTRFSWTGDADESQGYRFDNYYRVISGLNNNTLITGEYNTINQTLYETGALKNGTYTFNVKLNYTQIGIGTGYAIDETYTDSDGTMTFNVNKGNGVDIYEPDGSNLNPSIVTFKWLPTISDPILSGYKCILSGGINNINTGGRTENEAQRTYQKILNYGNYDFTVIMYTIDANGIQQTVSDKISFTVTGGAGIYLNISSPEPKTYTGEGEREKEINFSWNGGGSDLISGYSYTIKKGSTTIESGATKKNDNGTYTLGKKALSGGTYTFTVIMLDDDGDPIINPNTSEFMKKEVEFTVVIPSALDITKPTKALFTGGGQEIEFAWNGFAEFSHYTYKYELIKEKNGSSTIIKSGNNLSLNTTGFTEYLQNATYRFYVYMMSGTEVILNKDKSFTIFDNIGLALEISDGTRTRSDDNSKIETGSLTFNWIGASEDFHEYYYSITGTNFKGEQFTHTGKKSELESSDTLKGLSSGKYRFYVNMLDENGSTITGKALSFEIKIPSSLTITNPTNGSSINSSSTTFTWKGSSDILWYGNDKRKYRYRLVNSYGQDVFPPQTTNNNSLNYNFAVDGSYNFIVELYSGSIASGNVLASDNVSFSVVVPKAPTGGGGGGGGGGSSKSHPTNDLAVNITNDEPTTDERVEVVVDVNDKYTGKVDFTKMQYYSFDEEKWIDIPVTSDHYVSDSSDDAKLGYVKFTSDDDGEKELSEFLKFSQPGNYRLYAEDKDGYREYVEFYIGKGSAPAKVDEEDYYIARSCKKYKIEYYDKLGVYSSPNLIRDEFFVSRDYFYRYIDSKNKQIDGCPTNYGWINTTYNDTSNSSQRYTAPNGKVYFISNENGTYSSSELNKELNGAKRFSSINELKYFIRDRNPFINMYAPVK